MVCSFKDIYPPTYAGAFLPSFKSISTAPPMGTQGCLSELCGCPWNLSPFFFR
ncbi:hypothetical protein X975_02353, partial [Stegodyphus mimosarum]